MRQAKLLLRDRTNRSSLEEWGEHATPLLRRLLKVWYEADTAIFARDLNVSGADFFRERPQIT